MLSSLRCAMAVPCNSHPPPSLKLPASEDFHMTSRFPEPWRIAEFPNGFAVYDATDRHLGFFYGRTDPNMPGDGFLMIDDARQIAADFAMLPELLNQISGRRETPTTNRRSISFEPEGRSSGQMLRRPSDPRSIRTKFLILIAVAALPAGYLFLEDSDHPVSGAVVSQVTTNRLSAEFSPLQEAKAFSSKATDITIETRIEPEAMSSTVERPIELSAQSTPFQPTVPLKIKPTENGIEARPPETLPQREVLYVTPNQDTSTCFPSASAVRRNYPEARPSWTLRAPGHEGTRCWYPRKRTAPDTRKEGDAPKNGRT
jgi:hypothetical protein